MDSLLIRGGRLASADTVETTDILLQNGKVALGAAGPAGREIDASGMLIFPGLIDCHVHFREPGLTHKATMQSEARSARAGGVTTVCDMPNTRPPTFTVAALADKVRRAERVKDCDIRFFFGATEPTHLNALRSVWTGGSEEMRRLKSRCCGLKLFLENSTGDLKINPETVEEAFALCGEIDCPIVAHCEDPQMNAAASARIQSEEVASHSARRPPESEAAAIRGAAALAERHGTHLHIAHLSTALGLEAVRSAKTGGAHVTCEVTPHHLFLNESDYGKLGTFVKMNPPIRAAADCEALWGGIADGTIDCVATDHAPHLKEEKKVEPPLSAPSGVPGVETMLPLLLTAAASGRIRYGDILRLCFTGPNAVYRLQKEGVENGASPDIVIVDPACKWEITSAQLHSMCGWTPFEGFTVTGKVVHVLRASEGYALKPERTKRMV